ncbi:putative Kunitz-type serine protease inhibitor isoform X2 [Lissotriton helveticus]
MAARRLPFLLLLVLPVWGQSTPSAASCPSTLVSKPGQGVEYDNLPMMAGDLGTFPVDTAEQCTARCCSDKRCNLAMVQDVGGKKTCYLVDCLYNDVNVCELGPIPGFESYQSEVGRKPTLAAVENNSSPLDRYPLKHSSDLFNYEDYCTPKSETGLCRASIPRWYFDTESSTCKAFTFGGCGGNKNNFKSEKECLDKCFVPKPDPQKIQGVNGRSFQEYCAVDKVTGPCRAAFPRWYYDVSTGACSKFIYGGCKGNKNNYLSEADCTNNCVDHPDEHENYDPLHPFHHSTTAVALSVLLAIMIAILLGAMVVVFVKMARRNQRNSGLGGVWSPIDDKECLMNNAYTL